MSEIPKLTRGLGTKKKVLKNIKGTANKKTIQKVPGEPTIETINKLPAKVGNVNRPIAKKSTIPETMKKPPEISQDKMVLTTSRKQLMVNSESKTNISKPKAPLKKKTAQQEKATGTVVQSIVELESNKKRKQSVTKSVPKSNDTKLVSKNFTNTVPKSVVKSAKPIPKSGLKTPLSVTPDQKTAENEVKPTKNADKK